jgi:hypothetical protein
VKTFDRRSKTAVEAEEAKTSIRYMVAHSLSPFRKTVKVAESEKPAEKPKKRRKKAAALSAPATSAAVPGK